MSATIHSAAAPANVMRVDEVGPAEALSKVIECHSLVRDWDEISHVSAEDADSRKVYERLAKKYSRR
jgi:hypothetical protein